MHFTTRALPALVLAGSVLIGTPAAANMMLPMYFVPVHLNFFGLIPVIIVEGIILQWTLGLHPARTAIAAALANLISFAAGVAIAVLLLVVVGSSEWSVPKGHVIHPLMQALTGYGASPVWFVVGFLVVTFVFFLGSWWIETRVLASIARVPRERARKASLRANATSYSLMVGVVAFLLLAA
jgi:hypothetical protein